MNQVRIITELEKEKKKMQDDVLKLKEAKVSRVDWEAVSSLLNEGLKPRMSWAILSFLYPRNN